MSSDFWGSQSGGFTGVFFVGTLANMIARFPRLRAPSGHSGASTVFVISNPPRGCPVGGGGTSRPWGYGGISPHHYDRPCPDEKKLIPAQTKEILRCRKTP